MPNRNLHEQMVDRGLGPNQLAIASDVSAPTIRLALRGHVPTLPVQLALAEALDCRVTVIFPMERQRVYGQRVPA